MVVMVINFEPAETGREERSGVTGAAQNGGLQHRTWPLGNHRPGLVGKRGLRVLFSTEGDTSRSEEVALQRELSACPFAFWEKL